VSAPGTARAPRLTAVLRYADVRERVRHQPAAGGLPSVPGG
jgi:hypothetical protein